MAKNGSNVCNYYYVNWTFRKKFIRKHFFYFSLWTLKDLMFLNNTVKISEILNKGNLLKTLSLPALPISAYFAAIFIWEKLKILIFF